jgi:hypothetical protein
VTASPSVTFVLCIEANAMRSQALLLCESIRAFGGPHRNAPIIAVAPRVGLGVDRDTRDQLRRLNVDYVEEPLNLACPEYGSANRVFAARWAEPRTNTDWIVVLDSDTVFLEPLELPLSADVAVRAVDAKGATSEGPDDPFDNYWASLAEIAQVPLSRLPFVQTTDGGHRVRASYNGGLVVVRRSLGILSLWGDLFERSIAAGLKPLRGSELNVFASTGLVGVAASEYWGSNQAALAFAIWSTTSRVLELPNMYNVPLHLLMQRPDLTELMRPPLVHVHYHWLFTEPYAVPALALLQSLGVAQEKIDWLSARLPI